MADKNRSLRSVIYNNFDTESACAKALGWPRQQLNKITNGVKEPNLKEVNALANVLGISVETVVNFFI